MKYYAEKDLPAKEITSPEEAWLPEPQCCEDRKKSPQGQKVERPLAPHDLKALSTNRVPQSPQSNGTGACPGGQHASARWGGRKRIRARREFNEIYAHGNNFTNSFVVLKFLANEKGYSRAAFSAGKRLGKAVERNRARRLMREALRSLEVKPGWDLLFLSRAPAMNADFYQIRSTIKSVLDRAGILAVEKSANEK